MRSSRTSPPPLLAASRWRTKALGAWQRPEEIFVLEGRALLKGLERVAFTRKGNKLAAATSLRQHVGYHVLQQVPLH